MWSNIGDLGYWGQNRALALRQMEAQSIGIIRCSFCNPEDNPGNGEESREWTV
jgi:hypothetical protein